MIRMSNYVYSASWLHFASQILPLHVSDLSDLQKYIVYDTTCPFCLEHGNVSHSRDKLLYSWTFENFTSGGGETISKHTYISI